MRYVTVRDLRSRPGAVWRSLRAEGELAVTSNGRPVALLTAADETTLLDELTLRRRVRAEQAVATIRRRSADNGRAALTPVQIEREIAAARKTRKRPTGKRA